MTIEKAPDDPGAFLISGACFDVMTDLLLVTVASALAGFVDAIVGGGGLVLAPALFAAYPGVSPATLFGTNKGASVWGTAWAARLYTQRVKVNWSTLGPAVAAAFVGAALGACLVTLVPASGLRRALPFILAGVLIYTLSRRELGREHAPRLAQHAERWAGVAIGAAIGFYDGFFGPGTGSFFVFLLVRWLGYDFLNASASAKVLNVATNVAALTFFVSTGHIMWLVAACMAAANVLGSFFGTRLALRRGAGFVRGVFIVVVTLLILRTGFDAWRM